MKWGAQPWSCDDGGRLGHGRIVVADLNVAPATTDGGGSWWIEEEKEKKKRVSDFNSMGDGVLKVKAEEAAQDKEGKVVGLLPYAHQVEPQVGLRKYWPHSRFSIGAECGFQNESIVALLEWPAHEE
ncbi:hypothetical protein NL676_014242 [Syzygium grande]|nr:hypothetical protein NL676_014242 [Syzygium grande]